MDGRSSGEPLRPAHPGSPRRRHAAASAALCQARPQTRRRNRRHLADRPACRHGGARRDPHDPSQEGRHPQHHQHRRRRRARPGVVAGRQVDRVLLRSVRGVRPVPEEAERPRHGAGHRARRAAVVLLPPHMVARQHQDRLHGQALEPVVRRHRRRQAGAGRHRPLRHADTPVRRPVVARQPLAHLHQAAAQPAARRLRLLTCRRQGHPGHRRHERRALPRLRQERQVPLLHRQHRRRAQRRLARHEQPGPPGDPQLERPVAVALESLR